MVLPGYNLGAMAWDFYESYFRRGQPAETGFFGRRYGLDRLQIEANGGYLYTRDRNQRVRKGEIGVLIRRGDAERWGVFSIASLSKPPVQFTMFSEPTGKDTLCLSKAS